MRPYSKYTIHNFNPLKVAEQEPSEALARAEILQRNKSKHELDSIVYKNTTHSLKAI
jgi:hypothetical protein